MEFGRTSDSHWNTSVITQQSYWILDFKSTKIFLSRQMHRLRSMKNNIFCAHQGIIIQVGHGVFALADSIGEGSHATGVIPSHIEETDSDSPMASTSSQRATELQVNTNSSALNYFTITTIAEYKPGITQNTCLDLQMFWSYIEAMLTNLESLPLPRIHSMLKLFATVECSSEELQKFLDEKVSQNLLVYSAGQYQLPK